MKKRIFSILGLLFSTVPPLSAMISYFPVWAERGNTHVFCGFTLFLFFICVLPFYRRLKEIFKSPSVTTVWFLIFLVFFMLSKIADEITVIAFIGFIGNLIGSLCYRIARGKSDEGKA
jgi:hypothetical protein